MCLTPNSFCNIGRKSNWIRFLISEDIQILRQNGERNKPNVIHHFNILTVSKNNLQVKWDRISISQII